MQAFSGELLLGIATAKRLWDKLTQAADRPPTAALRTKGATATSSQPCAVRSDGPRNGGPAEYGQYRIRSVPTGGVARLTRGPFPPRSGLAPAHLKSARRSGTPPPPPARKSA